MIDVYRIGVTLTMVNGVSPVLAVLAKEFLGLKGSIKSIEEGFRRLEDGACRRRWRAGGE